MISVAAMLSTEHVFASGNNPGDVNSLAPYASQGGRGGKGGDQAAKQRLKVLEGSSHI